MAPVGENSNNNGMQLSVLSALARQGVDPWEEAAGLSRMASEAAIRKLTSLIAAIPDGPSPRLNPEAIAARLIPLLPHNTDTDIPSPAPLPGVGMTGRSWRLRYIIIYAICMVYMIVVQWRLANHAAATQSDKPSTSISSAASSQTPPRRSGR